MTAKNPADVTENEVKDYIDKNFKHLGADTREEIGTYFIMCINWLNNVRPILTFFDDKPSAPGEEELVLGEPDLLDPDVVNGFLMMQKGVCVNCESRDAEVAELREALESALADLEVLQEENDIDIEDLESLTFGRELLARRGGGKK